MRDPFLENKIGKLESKKWKVAYQAGGQNLQKINFYPDEKDWAKLSILSASTGFSRCFLFVFLLVIDLETIPSDDGGTPPILQRLQTFINFDCRLSLRIDQRKLIRTWEKSHYKENRKNIFFFNKN